MKYDEEWDLWEEITNEKDIIFKRRDFTIKTNEKKQFFNK